MGSWSITHWIIVLIVVALVFGTKKLRNMGEDLGAAVKGFKDGMKQGQEEGKKTDKEADKEVSQEMPAPKAEVTTQSSESAAAHSNTQK